MNRDEFRLYATGNGILQFILSAGSAAAAAGVGWILTALGNDTAGPTLFTMWFVFLTWPIQEFIRRSFYTRGVITKALGNTLLSNFVRMSILGVWTFQGGLTGRGGLDAIGWGSLVAIVFGLWQARDYWTTRNVGLISILKKNWGFGKWILGGSVANWGAVEVYPILAAGLISFAAAGAYRALQNLVAPVHVLLRAIDTFLTPRAAWLYQREGYQGLGRALRLIYLISGLPILGLLALVSIFPKPILHLFYGDTYLPFSDGTFLMTVFYAFWYAFWPLLAAFKAIRLTRPIFLANLGAILSMFTIGVWAIHQWGIYGAIGGQALNALIVCAGLWATWIAKPRSQPQDYSEPS
jgi:O-antigen/teichoic acid export membrane protein